MHKIERMQYGFRITNSGQLNIEEAEELKCELLQTLSNYGKPFCLLIDIRGLVPVSSDVMDAMRDLQRACCEMSLERVAIVVASPVLRGQAAQVSFDAGSSKHDRVIDASKVPDWEEQAIAWLVHGVEPSQSPVRPQA